MRLLVFLLLILFTLSYHSLTFGSDPTSLFNPILSSNDTWGIGKDNDGNGFVDDNCEPSLLR